MLTEKDLRKFDSVGIIMVATHSYLPFWHEAVLSIEKYAFLKLDQLEMHLFTNASSEVEEWAVKNLKRVVITTHPIEDLKWPFISLLRYDFICSIESRIKSKFIMYLDSDMLVLRDFSSILLKYSNTEEMLFVQHPGYHMESDFNKILQYLRFPRFIKLRLYALLHGQRGLGDWESNQYSSAYVAPRNRRSYVHGAVWFGTRKTFIKMSRELAENIKVDLAKGYIAKWHDESHLNWFFSQYGGVLLNCQFSGYLQYKHLESLVPYIITVPKNVNR